MAITEISDYGIGDNNFTSFMNSLDVTRLGQSSVTISEYGTDDAPDVKVGSWFECNGALYQVATADETPSGYAGISTSSEFYMYYDDSEGEFAYSGTVPTWSDTKQGWYHPTNVNDRAFFSMYKDSGGTLYQEKTALQDESFPKQLSLDTISEKTTGAGVTIDEVLHVDTISEKTTDAGVTIDEVLYVDTIAEKTAGAGVAFGNFVKFKKYYVNTNVTGGTLFTIFSSWVSTVGNALACEGQLVYSTFGPGIILALKRYSSTQIEIHYYRVNTQTVTYLTFNSGDTNYFKIEIMSNYDEITPSVP